MRGRGDADAKGGLSSRAAADPLPRSTMAQPGTLNLNNEVSTEVWGRVGMPLGAFEGHFCVSLKDAWSGRGEGGKCGEEPAGGPGLVSGARRMPP